MEMTQKQPLSVTDMERALIKKFRRYLWSPFIKAVIDFRMIEKNDRVAVAISGGKDSLVLAKLIQELQRHSDVYFEPVYISMDPGFDEQNKTSLLQNCRDMDIPVHFFDSDIFEVAEKVASDNPCYMCARMRRGALYAKAEKLGCNKLALGHHFNDVNETTMMNLLYTGCFKTMLPKLRSKNFENMEIIRPLYYVYEEHIKKYMDHIGISPMNCGCTVTKNDLPSKRKEVKKLIDSLKKENPNVEKCIFKSIKNINLDCCIGWQQKDQKHFYLDEDY
ncbi:MAG: ATP-binding protein [Filifactor alocis]|nr:ATP-binding protein [Filifactor alocis]